MEGFSFWQAKIYIWYGLYKLKYIKRKVPFFENLSKKIRLITICHKKGGWSLLIFPDRRVFGWNDSSNLVLFYFNIV